MLLLRNYRVIAKHKIVVKY